MRKIPATIITGFLGAGKTSLISHLIAHAGGRRIALLINEFGDVGVDGAILESCGVANCATESSDQPYRMIELPNGCICCTVAEDFLPAMERLLALPGGIDHLLIETSGLALPKPLVKAFDWPQIRTHFTVDGVVVVVDGPAVAAGQFAEDPEALLRQQAEIGVIAHDNPLAEVYEDQLLCADLVIMNKTDLMTHEQLVTVRAEVVRELSRAVPILEASHGKLSPELLLGLEAAAEDDLAARPSHHDAEEEHDHEDFATVVANCGVWADARTLHAALAEVIAAHGVLRVKGFVQLAGKPMRYLVQAVGGRIQGQFDGPCRGTEGNLVVIGRHGLDAAAIQAAFTLCDEGMPRAFVG